MQEQIILLFIISCQIDYLFLIIKNEPPVRIELTLQDYKSSALPLCEGGLAEKGGIEPHSISRTICLANSLKPSLNHYPWYRHTTTVLKRLKLAPKVGIEPTT